MTIPSNQNILPEDLEIIQKAKNDLENLGRIMNSLNQLGNKVEKTLAHIPAKQRLWIETQVNKALMLSVRSNLLSMEKQKSFKSPSIKTYKALVTTTGFASGAFGSATGLGTTIFASELIISTQFMMRSILDIARSEGEDLSDFDTQLACMQVFALGGTTHKAEGLDTSYYTTRIALDAAFKGVSNFMAKNGIQGISKLLQASSNPLIKVIGIIAGRFSIQVSEKFLAQAIPIAGAVGGGSINFVFINHFQTMAKSHFAIRRLERKYGKELVMETYMRLGPKTQNHPKN